ncbi:MAG: peptidylprolyl isomerase [Desulfovibrio sp.]|jgi:hypothetical protein|nr:peptidylprolyl isomerase [Desulfovibrio sp.]
MLDYIRANAQSFGVKLAFGVIILVFVFWGVGSFTNQNFGSIIASVNGEDIQIQQFELTYQNAEYAALRDNPGITRQELKKRGLGRQVLQEIVSESLLSQEAARCGLTVSATELRQTVGQIKAFQDEQGRFDPEAYKRVLLAQHTSPARYESSLAASLLRDKVYVMITSPAWLAGDEARKHYNFLRQTRQIEYIFLPAKNFVVAAPTDEEMQAYYDAYKEEFALPPKVAVEYITVKPAALLKSPDANTAEAQKRETDRLHEVLDTLMEDNILNKNLQESAARFGLTAQKTDLLPQSEIEKILGIAPDKAAVILESSAGLPVDTIFEAQDQFFIVRVLNAAPKSLAPFSEVKNAITARLSTEKGLAAAKKKATGQLGELDAAPLKDARRKELRVRTASLRRMDDLVDFQPDASLDEAIFAAAPQQWLSVVFVVDSKADGPGALLCRTTAVNDPDLQEWQGLQSLMENISARERSDGLFQIFMFNLLSRATVEVYNQEIVDHAGL